MTLNTKQPIPKKLYVSKRTYHYGIIDTTEDKHNNVGNFMKLMSVISSRIFPSFINDLAHSWWYVENALEEVRQEYFNGFPSRLSCTFLSDSFHFDSHKHQATVFQDAKVIKCDMAIINFLRANQYALNRKSLLKGYWEGKTLTQALESPNEYGSLWEYLVQGKVYLKSLNV